MPLPDTLPSDREGAISVNSPPGDPKLLLGDVQRLHPATLFIPLAEALLSSLVPTMVASWFIGPLGPVFFLVVGVLLPTGAFHALRYLTLRFFATDKELVIQSGILARRERRIPLHRVQEVRISQSIIHRPFGLAKVEISTAGSDAKEGNLSVITHDLASDLQRHVSQCQSRLFGPDDAAHDQSDALDYEFTLPLRTLIQGGLTSQIVATIVAVVTALIYFNFFLDVGANWWGNLQPKIQNKAPVEDIPNLVDPMQDKLPDWGPVNVVVKFFFDETLSKSLLFAVGGMLLSVGAYMLRYYGFCLERRGELLRTTHGLLTRSQDTLPRDRIQALKVEEGLLRRWLGLAAIRVDSAGDRQEIDENKNRDVLLPVAPRTLATQVAQQAIPALESVDPDWQKVSRKAIMRGTKKGWLFAILIMAQFAMVAGWLCLIWLPAFPLVYLLNAKWHSHTGYWWNDRFVLFRKGWINRSTLCLPVQNIQNICLSQTYFDRRRDLATLTIDTAGQSNTGGGPRIRHLPLDRAHHIQSEMTRLVANSACAW